MVLDSSAIVALVLNEPESPRLKEALQAASVAAVGTPTLLESLIVLASRLGPQGRSHVEKLLAAADVEVLPFTAEHVSVAYEAFLLFGRGRHPASLNYGDCMAYATAKVSGLPVLFIGSDFSQTDVAGADR